MRMAEGDADLFTFVFEDVDVADLSPRAELAEAICPHVHEEAHPFERELRQRELVFRCVDDDFASRCCRPYGSSIVAVGPECRKPVLKDDDLECIQRDLGSAALSRWAQWARVDGEEGAVVALGGVRDPLLAQRVEPKLRHRRTDW